MKKFVYKTVLFFSPFLLFFGILELYLSLYPSVFKQKSMQIEHYKDSVTVLVLGSSHNQDAIIGDNVLTEKVLNLAISGQDLKLDYLLLKKYISTLNKLKYVIIELSYHTLEYYNNSDYFKNTLYLRYFGINNFNRCIRLKDLSIFLSSPNFYLKFIKNKFESNNSSTEDIEDKFFEINYDTIFIQNDTNNIFINRHKYENIENFSKNCLILYDIVEICTKNNIQVYFVSTPTYKTYFDAMLPTKFKRRNDVIKKIEKKFDGIVFLNYENSMKFNIYDFKNEDHLNNLGAKKFT
ncbi:MAG: hypothetical protein JXR68_06110, partial [Bacteroidales bacterium]|nr:hypothetical protein [Bacteroidales bacterium]